MLHSNEIKVKAVPRQSTSSIVLEAYLEFSCSLVKAIPNQTRMCTFLKSGRYQNYYLLIQMTRTTCRHNSRQVYYSKPVVALFQATNHLQNINQCCFQINTAQKQDSKPGNVLVITVTSIVSADNKIEDIYAAVWFRSKSSATNHRFPFPSHS